MDTDKKDVKAMAITIRQPHAQAVAMLLKKIETRSWKTSYRGLLVIHAAKSCRYEGLEVWKKISKRGLIDEAEKVPMGAALGVCTLADCVPVEDVPAEQLTELERLLGDYSPGRFAWMLRGFIPFPKPVWCKGKQGLWIWKGDLPSP